MSKKVGIIGLGNPLRRDDGIGIELLELLRKKKKRLPKYVELIDGGTSGMNLLHFLARYDVVVIIDAVDFKGSPGEFRFFTTEDIKNNKMPVRGSTHEPDFLQIIRIADELHQLPARLLFCGIQPKDISYGQGLSLELTAALQTIKEALEQKLLTITS